MWQTNCGWWIGGVYDTLTATAATTFGSWRSNELIPAVQPQSAMFSSKLIFVLSLVAQLISVHGGRAQIGGLAVDIMFESYSDTFMWMMKYSSSLFVLQDGQWSCLRLLLTLWMIRCHSCGSSECLICLLFWWLFLLHSHFSRVQRDILCEGWESNIHSRHSGQGGRCLCVVQGRFTRDRLGSAGHQSWLLEGYDQWWASDVHCGVPGRSSDIQVSNECSVSLIYMSVTFLSLSWWQTHLQSLQEPSCVLSWG